MAFSSLSGSGTNHLLWPGRIISSGACQQSRRGSEPAKALTLISSWNLQKGTETHQGGLKIGQEGGWKLCYCKSLRQFTTGSKSWSSLIGLRNSTNLETQCLGSVVTLAIPDHWIVCLSQSQYPLSQTKSNWSSTIIQKVVEASAVEFKWLWLLNIPGLVWFVLDISFLCDNSQLLSKVVLFKYWQAFMMVKLKIEQGLLMEKTKKNLGIFPEKKHIFWALPKCN